LGAAALLPGSPSGRLLANQSIPTPKEAAGAAGATPLHDRPPVHLDFFCILLPIRARFLVRLEIQEIGGLVGHRIGGTESA
jgi:hypothetical protein